MHRRSLDRAATLAVIGVLAVTNLASADSIATDGDAVTPGNQGSISLGSVLPGAVVAVPVSFVLTCGGNSHGDPGQTLTLTSAGSSAPTGGAVLSVTPGAVGPVPAAWGVDGEICPDPVPDPIASTTQSIVTIQAPPTVGSNYLYTVGFARSWSPTGNADATAVNQTPTLVIRLDVSDTPAPTPEPTATPEPTPTATPEPTATTTPEPTPTATPGPPAGLTATWQAPIGADATISANRGSNVPVKVVIAADGKAQTRGNAVLTIAECGGGTVGALELKAQAGRWQAQLDTGDLPGTCYTVTAVLEGAEAGSFTLAVTGKGKDRQPPG